MKIVLTALLVLLIACRGEERSEKPPIIVISIDTLRSDRLPAYGYTGVATPNIDALRRDAILFRNAYAHVPLTLPSHATMFTGTYPAENGVRDNMGFRLREDIPTIGELLKQKGYATGAAVSTFVLRRETGIARGFDFYDDSLELGTEMHNLGAVQRNGGETSRIAQEWISKFTARQPVFFMLHIYEPHTPYEPPEPFRTRYASSPYDGEVAAADHIVGSFIDFLKKKGFYDRAAIIVLSDHGEGLGDHGEDEHGIFLYREAIQVPLIVKLPGSRRSGEEVTAPVQLSDLFPTVAAIAKIDAPPGRGVSLLGKLDAGRAIFSESYFARFHFGWSELHSLIANNQHYIRAPKAELYDLGRDPAERTSSIETNRRGFAALRKALEPLVQEPSKAEQISPEEAQKLAALGYLGSSAPAGDAGERPDPKDKIGTFREVKLALGFFREERDLEAVSLFRKLVKESPGMLDIWDAMSRSLFRLGRHEDAIAAAKEGLRLSPSSSHFAVMIANASLELNRLEDAANHAELVIGTEPAQGREILARVELARKRYDEARRQAELALATKRDRISTLLTLARIENERNNPEAALQFCEQITAIAREKKIDGVRRLHFNRGDAMARLGRHREAEAEFRREISEFPNDPQAYKNLILLYVTEERLDDATAVIFDLERAAPTPPAYAAIAETLKLVGDPQGARYWARRGLVRFPEDRRLRSLSES